MKPGAQSFRAVLLCSVVAGAAAAQHREIGILGGGGFLTGVPVEGAAVATSAGFQNGAAAGVFLAHDLYSRIGGEIRYLFEQRNLRLVSAGSSTAFSGQAHVVHYDLVFHTRPRGERVRPYLAAGGGVKLFRGTGTEAAYQPLMQYAYLTRTQELKPMLTAGGGVKIQIGARMMLRIDIRDQITRFPVKLIAPAPGMAVDGWLHDVVPAVGLSWRF